MNFCPLVPTFKHKKFLIQIPLQVTILPMHTYVKNKRNLADKQIAGKF